MNNPNPPQKKKKKKSSFEASFSCESSSNQRSTLGPRLEANFNFWNFFLNFKIVGEGGVDGK